MGINDNDYINKKENYEIKYALDRNGKRETKLNQEFLKTCIDIYKMNNNKKRVTHEELDKIIDENSPLFEDKKPK